MCEHVEPRRAPGPGLVCVACGVGLCEDFHGATYSGWHVWIHRNLPQARQLACVACGRQAVQWAYTHTCTAERGPMPWCPHPEHYVPMCVPCHRRFDAYKPTNVGARERDERGRALNKDGSVHATSARKFGK